MGNSITVSSSNREKLLRYANELLQELGLNEKGEITTKGVLFPADVRLRIIASLLDLKPAKGDYFVTSLLVGTLFDLRRGGITSVDWPTVERALADQLDKQAQTLSVPYRILFPLNATGAWISELKSVTVLGHKFKKLSWGQVRNFSGWRDFLDSVAQHTGPQPAEHWDLSLALNFTPLIVDIQGHNRSEAFEEANTRFDLLRAIINLVTRRGISLQFGTKPSPLGRCLPPLYYSVFKLNGAFEIHAYNSEDYRSYPNNDLGIEHGKSIRKLLANLHLMNEDIRELTTDILIKYSRAVDTAEWHSAFLNLWQILETFVRPFGEKGALKNVSPGINAFLGNDQLRQDVLEAMETSRHNLVHYGNFSTAGSTEVSYLKRIVETVIGKLLKNPRMFRSRHELREFLQHVSLGPSVLRTRRRVISRILDTRPKKRP